MELPISEVWLTGSTDDLGMGGSSLSGGVSREVTSWAWSSDRTLGKRGKGTAVVNITMMIASCKH